METHIAIILNIISNRNPALLFCLRELSNKYKITVISPDKFEDPSKFPNVSFLNCWQSFKWASRIERIFKVSLGRISQIIEFFPKLFNPNFNLKFLRNFGEITGFVIIQRMLLPFLYLRKLSRMKDLSGVICIDAGSMTSARKLKRNKKIPFIYWAYEIYPNQFTATPEMMRKIMEDIERKGCIDAKLVIVTTTVWAKFLRRRYKAYNLKHQIVCVCPPPVEKYADLQLSDKVKFYYHGGYTPGRGLENLVSAMQYVEGGILYFRGIGKHFEQFLKNETNRLKLNHKIKFLPPVPTEQLAEEATKFDIGVMMVCMTTLNAKFLIGFKTFENITAGLALFSPASYQLKNIVSKENVGVIFRDCSEKTLAETMQYCISHREEIKIWKLNARKYARREINPAYQSQQLLEAIEELTNKN